MAVLKPQMLIKRVDGLKGLRGNWEDHWQELANFHLPRKATINSRRTPGDKRNTQLLDNTGMKSLEKLAGFLQSELTNPTQRFFDITTGDVDLDDQDAVRAWRQDSVDKMLSVINRTNFQTQVHEMYLDLCCFGTGAMFMEEDPNEIIRFTTHTIDKLLIDEDSKSRVNQVYRVFEWTASQIMQEFGEEEAGPEVKKSYDRGENRKFTVHHGVYPEDETKQGGRFVSQYVLRDYERNLRVAFFNEMPFVTPRWSKTSDEIYGRSPGMTSLPEMKTLNKMMETTIKGAQKVVDPPLQVPDDGFIQPIRVRPGSLNYFRAGSGDRIEPFANDARIDFGFQAMDDKRQRVRDAFFVDELRLREADRMTATEVMQRREESSRLLGPMLGRQQTEFLRPLFDRVFGIMLRRGMFNDPPEVLEGKDVEFIYSSSIARSQKIAESQNILRGIESIGPFLQIDPNAADNIDSDAAVTTIAKAFDWPQEIIRSVEEVSELRQSRAEAQEQAVQAEQEAQQAENLQKVTPAIQAIQG